MKTKLNRILMICAACWCFSTPADAQQNAQASQYHFNTMVINPAYPGADSASSITLQGRNQWMGVEGAPQTATFAFYTPLKASNTSLGFTAIQDKITVYSQTGFNANVAQKVKLDQNLFLSMGIKVGMEQTKEDNTSLGTDDPVFAQNQRYWKTDVGFGFMIFNEKFQVGLSSPSFQKFDMGNSVNKLEFKRAIYLHGAYLADINEDFKIKPGLLVRQVKGAGIQCDLNAALLIKNMIWIGGTWRSEKTMGIFAQIQVSRNFQFAYAYDFASAKYLKGGSPARMS
ncbi:type IX secretion system membrane protein PorP/SprF [Chitinophaga horti]|uniref:Type IX secretion system membrane protein PorP/SprF n=1 Tax=Chitinophaga horti TaxID=2920382 RepID=A0ABY6IVS0_9BACT|nr:type IX secretion system membrane protein PorP/SprF [Chitinophaga horti]UYQ91473.1 type IX secretion system membrane protein PorP/SprF [Chitinophaga horti]